MTFAVDWALETNYLSQIKGPSWCVLWAIKGSHFYLSLWYATIYSFACCACLRDYHFIILVRACTHRGWAHPQRVRTTFSTRKNSKKNIVLLTGLEPSSFGSESGALPIEPPRHPKKKEYYIAVHRNIILM